MIERDYEELKDRLNEIDSQLGLLKQSLYKIINGDQPKEFDITVKGKFFHIGKVTTIEEAEKRHNDTVKVTDLLVGSYIERLGKLNSRCFRMKTYSMKREILKEDILCFAMGANPLDHQMNISDKEVILSEIKSSGKKSISGLSNQIDIDRKTAAIISEQNKSIDEIRAELLDLIQGISDGQETIRP